MDHEPHDPPWSIPVREPGPDVPHRAATWIDQLPLFPFIAGGVLVFVALVAGILVLGEAPSGTEPEVLGNEGVAATTTAPEAPVTTSSTSTTTATTASTTTVPTTTSSAPSSEPAAPPATDPEPAGVPIVGPSDVSDGWVAQVSSVPSSAGGNALARAHETVTATVPGAVVLRGHEWPVLREGYFVVVQTGFDSAAGAVDACDASGRTGRDQCFARWLSASDEAQRTCWRDESGALAGDCG